MIQRLQTIYLLLAIACMSLTLVFSTAWLTVAEGKFYTFTMFGLEASGLPVVATTAATYSSAILVALCVLYLLWSIFSYRTLKSQQTRIMFSMFFILLYIVYVAYSIYDFSVELKATIAPNVGAFLPLAALIFCGLAWKGVHRDYKLLRSVDRIR